MILTIFFILVFILIHELGHFITAKIFRIPVEKFSIGFGPPLIRRQIGETDFRIAYFPLGGYVKFTGDDEGEIIKGAKKDQNTDLPCEPVEPVPKDVVKPAPTQTPSMPGFYDAPLYSRIIVVFTGPLFNIISAFVLFAILYIIYGTYTTPYMSVQVKENSIAEKIGFKDDDSLISLNGQQLNAWEDFEELMLANQNHSVTVSFKRGDDVLEKVMIADPDSHGLMPKIPSIIGSLKVGGPAYKAGLRVGDKIISINGEPIKTWDQLAEKIWRSPNITLNVQWQHDSEIISSQITPMPYYNPVVKDTIGLVEILMPLKRINLSVFQSTKLAVIRSYNVVYQTLTVFYWLITRQISSKTLGGPIAIFFLGSETSRWGLENLLALLGIISINLGIVNLFPIPAFDGGHIIIGMIEGIRRKRFTRQTRLIIQNIGYAIILILAVYVTFNDITRYFFHPDSVR